MQHNYFSNFPLISYPYVINGEVVNIRIVDISANVRFLTEFISAITLYDEYDIQDGDTPEIIAYKLYGDANLHWVIMLLNEKFDFYNDFPLSSEELYKFVVRKYGEDRLNDIHFYHGTPMYVDQDGNIVDRELDINGDEIDSPLLTAVSNYDYELRVNEKKRRIKAVSKSMIPQILTELSNRLSN